MSTAPAQTDPEERTRQRTATHSHHGESSFFTLQSPTAFEKEGRCQGQLQREPGTQAATEQSLAQLCVCQHPCTQNPWHTAAAPYGTAQEHRAPCCWQPSDTAGSHPEAQCCTWLETAWKRRKERECCCSPQLAIQQWTKGTECLIIRPQSSPSTLIPGRNHRSALATQEFQPHNGNQHGEWSERENTEADR